MGQHGEHGPLVRAAALAAALVAWGGAAEAQATCRLALLLALDISSSVDAQEDALQRKGLATALLAPEVQAAFLDGDLPVALAVYEWSGRWVQETVLDWRLITSETSLLEAAEVIAGSKRSYAEFPTALGYAMGHGATMLAEGPRCLFSTIDVSGDGENNEGFGPQAAYREFPFAGVTVNGLVINGGDYEAEVSLIEYYRSEVLHGPGAFLEIANGFEDFERAMRRKLEREARPKTVGALPIDDTRG